MKHYRKKSFGEHVSQGLIGIVRDQAVSIARQPLAERGVLIGELAQPADASQEGTVLTRHQKLAIASKDSFDYPLVLLGGAFAALTLDEFALWLNLRDVYWERKGRESFEALALFGGLLAVGVLRWRFWHGVATELASIFRGSAAQYTR